jgi:hypothetical protein
VDQAPPCQLAPLGGCSGWLGSVHRDQFAGGRWRRHWLPALFEILNMKLNGFTNEQQGFIARRFPRGSRQNVTSTSRCRLANR